MNPFRWRRSLPPARANTSDPLTIEPLQRRDIRIIMPIEKAAYPTSWTQGIFEAELDGVASGNRYYIVAKRGRAVVGFAGIWIVGHPEGDQAHITNIVVDERHRRQGIASALMVALANEARRRGCTSWTLEVRATSTGAQDLYRSFGFSPVGVRKRYYDNSVDGIVMWCHDLGSDEYLTLLQERCP